MDIYDRMNRRTTRIEYWVAEVDAWGDVIDYTYQDNRLAGAQAEFNAMAHHEGARSKRIEKVVALGSEADGVIEQEITMLDERPV